MKNKLKVEIYHKARYVGDDSPEFEPLKIYRGEWLVDDEETGEMCEMIYTLKNPIEG